MTHADELARLRDAVVQAAKAYREKWLTVARPPQSRTAYAVIDAVDALLVAEAATCGKCKGRGTNPTCGVTEGGCYWYDEGKCPDCGGTGRVKEKA